ncbi:hypothetical protein [Streptomyces sp. NPDC051452]|uniref:hypothetical protein n=1 Tax=Streptomyces sp. NPDC051452 TaxID=3365654 RepID=UPI0037960DD8
MVRQVGIAGAVDEITEVEELSRQTLADVRAAVSGYREVTLAGELACGRELLRAAGIRRGCHRRRTPSGLNGWSCSGGSCGRD